MAPTTLGTSTFRGVNWDDQRSKWKAQIDHGKDLILLGHFADEKMAAMAFDYAARILVCPVTYRALVFLRSQSVLAAPHLCH